MQATRGMSILAEAPRVVLIPILSLAALPGVITILLGWAWVWLIVRARDWVER